MKDLKEYIKESVIDEVKGTFVLTGDLSSKDGFDKVKNDKDMEKFLSSLLDEKQVDNVESWELDGSKVTIYCDPRMAKTIAKRLDMEISQKID